MMSTEINTPVYAGVDFNSPGVQHGFLKLPHSHDESAWGAVMIPITVINGTPGPTALLTGGNHGDEYEGIIALLKLANSLKADEVKGRVIIVPMMNTPAVQAGLRTSPIDKGNLNRSFPGSAGGSVTEQIADYFTRVLVPMCDVALDLHSGGRTLDIMSFAALHRLENEQQQTRNLEAARSFGAPATVVMYELDASQLYDTVVESQGKGFVTTELGGGGTSIPHRQAIADRGVRNFLIHHHLIEGVIEQSESEALLLDMPDASCYLQSEHAGILELLCDLEQSVTEGDVLARIYDNTRSGQPPVEYRARRSGMVVARRFPAKVAVGDTLVVIAREIRSL
ncbi:N(2)-acetyl-L-2,4-diaminobutanoate deacetylase DoeB [Pantoea coffeiphila]|uniref:N(2)-acetyl-L-2,4-diaminobutanoate deacetylase DoeB n=1 Tax=Pantoea coffeiphila TaxID=1465635 RepID=UPI001EF93094|nr:N(2)-acetyl-L-2,4-diaminobutanoate deacetylase DoeB [Pantoea coffeiphila]MBM7345038.1 N-alpha-acetyl-L-2,4-diaminobutyrate deacetylase [Pantoea coffeiphila]